MWEVDFPENLGGSGSHRRFVKRFFKACFEVKLSLPWNVKYNNGLKTFRFFQMNLHLSWDLFILVFFAVVVAYSFIIGRNQTLKVILGTYMSILCADGLGNLFAVYFATSSAFLRFLKLFSIGSETQAITFFKVLVLISLTVLVAVRGLYEVDAEDDRPMSIQFIILLILGVLSAGLLMSAVLVFVSGTSLIGSASAPGNLLSDVYKSSRFVRLMLDYSNVWFLLPALSFLTLGMFHKK